jgi:hypothetical protein
VRRPVVAAVVTSGLCAAALSAAVAASAPTSAAEPAPHASERKAAATAPNGRLATAFAATTRSTAWRLAQRLPLRFPTHHPQGFALVGDRIFLSTVEILEPTVRFPAPWTAWTGRPARASGTSSCWTDVAT